MSVASIWDYPVTPVEGIDPPASEPQAPEESGGIPYVKIAIGLSAAYLAWRMWAKHRLQEEQPQTPKDAHILLMDLWKTGHKIWLTLSREPVEMAYSVIPYTAGRALAIDYATELGKYINDTSAEALLDGFAMQVNAGHNAGLAWTRSTEAYGLDTRQTKTYIRQLMTTQQQREIPEAIPLNAQAALDKAVLLRADRLGMNEAHKAVQTGKSMVWMTMAAMGDLPDGTRKKWVTAEDERVCAVCGPLDQVTIPLHWRFKTLGGEKFYAPGVHPNCRCDLELVYPERMDVVKAMAGDTWRGRGPVPDRDTEGHFAEVESRSPKTAPVKPVTLTPLDPVTLARYEPVTLDTMYRQAGVTLDELFTQPPVTLSDMGTRTQEQHIIVQADEIGRPDPSDDIYETMLLVPATRFLELNGLEGLASRESVGKPVSFGFTGYKSLSKGYVFRANDEAAHHAQSDAFTAAFDDEASIVGARGLDYLRQAQEAGQDVARYGEIAPFMDDQKYNLYRKAFAGLNKGQLLHVVQSALDSTQATDYTVALFDPRATSADDVMEALQDETASEIATKILFAEKAESDENFNARTQIAGRAWTIAANDVLNVATMGKTSKAAAFGGLGDNPEQRVTAAVFRFPSSWMGDQQMDGNLLTGSPRGHYVVRDVTFVNVPSHLHSGAGSEHKQKKRSYLADEIDVIRRIAIIDLVMDPDVYTEMEWDPFDPMQDVYPEETGR